MSAGWLGVGPGAVGNALVTLEPGHQDTFVNSDNDHRAPLVFISGGEGHTVTSGAPDRITHIGGPKGSVSSGPSRLPRMVGAGSAEREHLLPRQGHLHGTARQLACRHRREHGMGVNLELSARIRRRHAGR